MEERGTKTSVASEADLVVYADGVEVHFTRLRAAKRTLHGWVASREIGALEFGVSVDRHCVDVEIAPPLPLSSIIPLHPIAN